MNIENHPWFSKSCANAISAALRNLAGLNETKSPDECGARGIGEIGIVGGVCRSGERDF